MYNPNILIKFLVILIMLSMQVEEWKDEDSMIKTMKN